LPGAETASSTLTGNRQQAALQSPLALTHLCVLLFVAKERRCRSWSADTDGSRWPRRGGKYGEGQEDPQVCGGQADAQPEGPEAVRLEPSHVCTLTYSTLWSVVQHCMSVAPVHAVLSAEVQLVCRAIQKKKADPEKDVRHVCVPQRLCPALLWLRCRVRNPGVCSGSPRLLLCHRAWQRRARLRAAASVCGQFRAWVQVAEALLQSRLERRAMEAS